MTDVPKQITTVEILPKLEAQMEEEAERTEFSEWKVESARTLQEIRDNDKDAVYDSL